MFPPTSTRRPAACSIRPTSVVVVDLPFVPVIATTRPRSQREASSSSPITGTPRERAAATSRQFERHAGTHDDEIGARRAAASSWAPSSSVTPIVPQPACLVDRWLHIRQRHVRPAADQQFRGGDAASCGAHDHHPRTLHAEGR